MLDPLPTEWLEPGTNKGYRVNCDYRIGIQIALVQDFINRSGELNYVDTYFDNRSQNFLFSPLEEIASEAKM